MRLIDADAFYDWMLSHFAEPQSALILTLQGFIAEQPTAYSVDKVIEELEKLADENYKAYCIAFNSDDRAEYDAYTNAIEIVKHGGVSDDVCEWNGEKSRLVTFTRFTTDCGDNIDLQTNSELLKAFRYCPFCGKKIKVVE